MRRRLTRLLIAAGLIALFLAACGLAASAPPAPGSTGSSPPPTLPPRAVPTDAEILDALRFRRAFGLREDEAWIITVALSPLSDEGRRSFGVPLMPFEMADLLGRPMIGSDTVRVIQEYGAAFPEEFGGVFFDQQAHGIVTGSFVDHLERHRAALKLLMPDEEFALRQVKWSLGELRGFIKEIEADATWFDDANLRLLSAEIDEIGNQVRLLYLGRVDALGAVGEHFGNPPWLRVERAGPGPWTGPLGNLIVVVVDVRGKPASGYGCSIYPDDSEAPVGEIGYGTNEGGVCEIHNLPVSTYLVEVGRERPYEEYAVVASGRVAVIANGTAVLRIVVPE